MNPPRIVSITRPHIHKTPNDGHRLAPDAMQYHISAPWWISIKPINGERIHRQTGEYLSFKKLQEPHRRTEAMTSVWRPEEPLTDGTGGGDDLGQAKHQKSITWCHKSAGGPAIHYRYIPDCA